MNLLFWGLTVSMVGKVLLVVGVLKAHGKIAEEHRIDDKVLRSFHIEKIITIIGLIFILSGYIMEVYFYEFATPLFSCNGTDCNDAAAAILSR